MKREAQSATVRVEFVVDSTGRVVAPYVVASTHFGFNDAAVAGVAKWKFRPGIRGGKRVNTRMQVPILFRITDAE
jgi:protein TonB